MGGAHFKTPSDIMWKWIFLRPPYVTTRDARRYRMRSLVVRSYSRVRPILTNGPPVRVFLKKKKKKKKKTRQSCTIEKKTCLGKVTL